MELAHLNAYRLRKLAQSGLTANELAAQIQELLEAERLQKSAPAESQDESTIAIFARNKAYLNLV